MFNKQEIERIKETLEARLESFKWLKARSLEPKDYDKEINELEDILLKLKYM